MKPEQNTKIVAPDTEPSELTENTVSEQSAAIRKSIRKPVIVGVGITLMIVVAGVFLWLYFSRFESTDDAYTTADVHPISTRVEGSVIEVLVEDNEAVQAGQLLMRLDPRDYVAAQLQAAAKLEQASAAVAERQAQAMQAKAQVLAAKAAVQRARAQLLEAEAEYEKTQFDVTRYTDLFALDPESVAKTEVEAVQAQRDIAEGKVQAANADIASAAANVEAAEAFLKTAQTLITAAQADRDAAEAELTTANLAHSYCEVFAPCDGRIAMKTVETGQHLQPGQPFLAVVADDVWVVANYKETQLAKIRVGQQVKIDIDAIPEQTFTGVVNSIQDGSGAVFSLLPPDNATGNFTKIVQRVPVKIVFDADSIRGYRERLIPGLSCEPHIRLESHQLSSVQPAQPVVIANPVAEIEQ